ncbi:EamA family transporter [Pelosinus sp. IPA-1]|uniref:DMT family transporter n=1 Tax=Pelosinus sp. IPA-1 TaxID=3029569 RepID=UPI0024362A3D|nr:EamA family transporter [Pelosinus sp. IPA-1]GMA98703.1 EamA family transporter [Pelosinus sp. IPA-1]
MSDQTTLCNNFDIRNIATANPSPRMKFQNIHLLLMTVPIFLGTSYVAAKIGMQQLLPLNLVILRFVVASFVFTLILLLKKGTSSIDKKDIPQFFTLGFFAITSFFYIHYTGLQYTTSTNAGLIMATTPVFAALFCIITKKEKVTTRSRIGICIAFMGVLLVISQGKFGDLFHQKTLLGDGLLILNALVWAWFTLKGKTVLEKYSPFTAMAYIHISGTILLLPFAFFPTVFAETSLLQQLPTISRATLLATAYLAVFCSVYSYFIWYLGISKIGAVKTAIFSYFNPIMAIVAGILFFDDKLTLSIALGGLFVILGVYITNQKNALSSDNTISAK